MKICHCDQNRVRLHFLSTPNKVERGRRLRPNWYKSWRIIDQCYEAKVLSLAYFTRTFPWKFWKQFHNCPILRLGPYRTLAGDVNENALGQWYRELKQPRGQRKRKPHKFAYLTMKSRIFARFARAFVIFWHFVDVLVLSMTWNDLFCSCVRREHILTNVQFCLLMSQALVPI